MRGAEIDSDRQENLVWCISIKTRSLIHENWDVGFIIIALQQELKNEKRKYAV